MDNKINLLKEIRSKAVSYANDCFCAGHAGVKLAEDIISLIDDAFGKEVRAAVEALSKEEADYFYNVADWDVTHHDIQNVVAYADEGSITEVGRLRALPSVFVATYIDADFDLKNTSFSTREAAALCIEENQYKGE